MSKNSNKYAIRRDSLISTWGIGSIVPFPHDESLMISGLDFWFDKNEGQDISDFIITDERLTKRLGGKIFVLPPDYRERLQDPAHAEMKIPAARFPVWHYCPVCGNMERIGVSGPVMRCSGEIRKESGKETFCSRNKERNKLTPLLIPERFIAVCPEGHIEDFPIEYWVHKKCDKDYRPESCRLVRSTGGSSSSLAGVRYSCTCGASANMREAFNIGALSRIGYNCRGNQPWLGSRLAKGCGNTLMVLQRGASNVWFAEVASSVYIPWIPKYKNQSTKQCIDMVVRGFSSSRTNDAIDEEKIIKKVNLMKVVQDDIDVEQAIEEIIATLKNYNKKTEELITDDEYKKQEFDVLIRSSGDPKDELYSVNYPSSGYKDLLYLKSISLVHKLRETRVFLGFRRISPSNPIAPISLDPLNWLPAVKNSGEGIMLEFNYKLLSDWASQSSVRNRVSIIDNNLKANKIISEERINPIYVLLHTFSHCLITALSNHSGYSNASIREKIYCSKYCTKNAPEMAGILIYTASGDAEGSLGGLVRQGLSGRIEELIGMAINEARWCAADPVCIQGTGQGQDGCNLAACHNCALLPETSCENKNKFLDRGLMIGTLENQGIGFFNRYYD